MGAFAGVKVCCNHPSPSFKKDIEFEKNETKKETNNEILDDLNNTNTKKQSSHPENSRFVKVLTVQSSTASIQKYKRKTSIGGGVNNISTKDEQNITTNYQNNNLNNTCSKNINNEPNINNSITDVKHINNNDKIKVELHKKSSKVSMHDINILPADNQGNSEEAGSKLLLSGELFFYKDIIVNIHGLKDSLRKKTDNIVFFGLKKCLDYKGNCFNDFIINYKSKYDEMGGEVLNSNTGRVFKIYFNKKTKEYMLYFMHSSLILYYKINNFVYFDPGKDYFLILGSIFLTVYVDKNLNSTKGKEINILVELENEEPKKYTFNQNQTPIRIGRLNCEVIIPKSSVSKHHSIIEFSNNMEMFYYRDLGSINGSTLIVKEDDYLKIKGEMNFKLEDVPFKILEIP